MKALPFTFCFGVLLGTLSPPEAFSDEVRVGFGESIPPYCIQETNSGIEVDIFREALAFRGHTLKPVFYPIQRVPVAFLNHDIDVAMSDVGTDLSKQGGIYAMAAVTYHNAFFTLKKRHLRINAPHDLAGLKILGFPIASKRFPDWLGPSEKAGNYLESHVQRAEIQQLLSGRYDVVLSDRYVFRYFAQQIDQESKSPAEFEEHDVLSRASQGFRAVFHDRHLKSDYEAGLKHLRSTGRYREIFDQYLKKAAP
jgi:polar amino acid transport system substrate-binding protein